ncbi:MAG: hypothetical protein WA940_02750 [Sphingopyxis sp.]
MSDASFDFGSRKRKIKDNGDDFEDFVFECLTISGEMPGLEKRLARGRDGAVDLADRFSDPGELAIAECKFIGSGGFSQAKARWKEVFKNLKTNLPALSAAPATRQASPYRAWLDRDRPVVCYRFCITLSLSDAEVRELEKIIAEDLGELVDAGVDELRHLAATAGAIRVLRWDWFHSELERHPALAFRWFRGLPKGIELFDAAPGGETSFRTFLNQGSLRYFSRDEYAAQPGAARIERREGDLIADLAGNTAHGLLISGPGGVGKTRLAHELASGLGSADHGFDIYQLGRSADYTSLETLAGRYSQPASILLMADYAEAIAKLADIAEAAEYLEAEAGHRIRIIATCRSSATNQVHGSLAALRPKQAHLASPLGGEEGFAQWVTQSILALERFPDADALERVCHGVPVLAAFAVYLFRRHRAAFDSQFGGLLNADGFDAWMQQRIILLLAGGGQAQQQTLARIGLALPCSRAELDELAAGDTNLLSRLRTDRWIEDDGALCYAAHDVLADALVGRWIFEAPHAATDRVIDLLDEAAGRDALLPALIALERQAQDPRFEALCGGTIAATLHARHAAQAPQWAGILLDGRLLDFDEKLALLQIDDLIRPIVEASRALDVQLCRLAGEAAASRQTAATNAQTEALADLLELAWQAGQFSNLVLRRAYALDPGRFRDRAVRNVDEFPRSETTHYMLTQLLRSGEPPDDLRQQVSNWLTGNSTVLRASFVYAAWLNAQGDANLVRQGALAWIDKYGTRLDAQFLYAAWLNAGEDPGVVRPYVLAWMEEYSTLPEMRFACTAWLDAGGATDDIRDIVRSWVALYGTLLDSSFVFRSWLNAGGDVDAIRDDALAWLDAHGDQPEARFLYTAWLNSGNDVDAVRDKALAWIAQHGASAEASYMYPAWFHATGELDALRDGTLAWIAAHVNLPEASYVYKAWLDAGGDIAPLREAIDAWIAEHGTLVEASFILAAWLDASGDTAALRDKIMAWIAIHGIRPEAQHVYAAWLNAAGDFDLVREDIERWIGEHHEHADAQLIFASWLKAGGEVDIVREKIRDWITRHGSHREADFLYRAWLETGGDYDFVETGLIRWVEKWGKTHDFVFLSKTLSKRIDLPESLALAIARWCAAFPTDGDALYRLTSLLLPYGKSTTPLGMSELVRCVQQVIMVRTIPTPMDRAQLWSICLSLGGPQQYNIDPFGIMRVIAAIIGSGTVFAPGLQPMSMPALRYTHGHIALLVLYGLRQGELSLDDDHSALSNFVAWLKSDAPTLQETQILLRRLDAEFPSPLWR